MKKVSKRKISKVSSFTLAAALVGSGLGLNVLAQPHYVHAVKDDKGVCQVETKTGLVKFTANSTEVTTQKPLDLLLVMDGSESLNNSTKASTMFKTYLAVLESIPEDSKVFIATYFSNRTTSYEGDCKNCDAGPLTKEQALSLIRPLANSGSPLGVDIKDKIRDAGLGVGVQGRPYEDWFAANLRPNAVHSVLQITDEWVDYEEIDSSFASWAKANAKTFMSVIIAPNENTYSYRSMVNAGHPNIYVTRGKGQSTINSEVVSQFKTTATEVSKPVAKVKANVEQGVSIKKVELVSPTGKRVNVPFTATGVDASVELLEDGEWTLEVQADGLAPKQVKALFSVDVSGKTTNGEVVFDGCQDDRVFTYSIVDTEGNELKGRTEITKGVKGSNYKLENIPTLDGYEVEVPEGTSLEGVFGDEDVNIKLVAYKLGKGAVLKTVDKEGKDILQLKTIVEDGKRVGVEYNQTVPLTIRTEKGKVYKLISLEKDGVVEAKDFTEPVEIKGGVSEQGVEYKAIYEEVKLGEVKVEFYDDKGNKLQEPQILNKEDSILGGDYSYNINSRLKVGEDVYAFDKLTLDGKDVKEIKGQFEEGTKVYKVVYKKVVKPTPKTLPKTSSVKDVDYGALGVVSLVVSLAGVLVAFARRFR